MSPLEYKEPVMTAEEQVLVDGEKLFDAMYKMVKARTALPEFSLAIEKIPSNCLETHHEHDQWGVMITIPDGVVDFPDTGHAYPVTEQCYAMNQYLLTAMNDAIKKAQEHLKTHGGAI